MPLSVRFLGNSRIEWDGQTLTLPAGKPRELFAYLVMHAGRMHHREVLTDILFPEVDPKRGRRLLSDVVYRLRHALGNRVLSSIGDYLALDENQLRVDVWEFIKASDARSAIDLYCGDLLEDIDADWLLGDRARMRDRALILLERHCTDLQALGQPVAALELAHRWIDIEPLSEQAHCAAMRLYAQLGRFSASLRQYERLSKVLSEELGIEPSPAAQTLRGLIKTEWDAELATAGQAVFVGRMEERARLAQLANATMKGSGAIVLIEGAIGVGKTRLLNIFAECARWRGFSVQNGIPGRGEVLISSAASQSGRRPQTVIIDDVHTAASRTWDAIVDVAPAIRQLPLMLVLGGRSRGLRGNENCWRTLNHLDDGAFLEHCVLEGLSVSECIRLAHAVGSQSPPSRIHSLHDYTKGNPRLFLDALRCACGFDKSSDADVSTNDSLRPVQVKLARADVPLGRALTAEDRVIIKWTVDAGKEDLDFLREHGSVALRRHRLRRLVAEARLQGAAPTHVELARALGYSVRTISRDFVVTRAAGTRRMR
jgi:DNA-binding SARP family transcriptional activator